MTLLLCLFLYPRRTANGNKLRAGITAGANSCDHKDAVRLLLKTIFGFSSVTVCISPSCSSIREERNLTLRHDNRHHAAQ